MGTVYYFFLGRVMKTNKARLRLIPYLLAVAFSSAACAGGTGIKVTNQAGASNSAPATFTPTYNFAFSVNPLNSNNSTYVTHDLFARDLNRDNVDEIIYAGRTTNYPGAKFEQSNMFIFSWDNKGKLTNQTSTWFAPGANIINGTEPSLLFGNFTGSKNTDIFVSPSTDTNNTGPAIIFRNTGKNKLERIELPGTDSWSHGSATFDINGDGKLDIMAVSYNNNSFTVLGGATPKVFSSQNNNNSGIDSQGRTVTGIFGSGLTLGKFNNDGKVYAIVVDGPSIDGVQGSFGRVVMMEVYNGFNYENGVKTTNQIIGVVPSTAKILPLPYLEAQQASNLGLSDLDYMKRGDSNASHDVRVVTLRVNKDALPDIAVISRPNATDNNWASVRGDTYVTFYKNNGNGNFTVAGHWSKSNSLVYNIDLRDVNGDKQPDIIMASQNGNTSILLAKPQKNGDIIYVEAGASTIKAFDDNIRSQSWECTGDITWCMGASNIVRGPKGKNYIVGVRNETSMDGTQYSHVYFSQIGSAGTLTLNGAIQTLMSQWNITEAQAAQILKVTGSRWADGTVIDINAAMQPVGGLWFPLNGKMTPLQGSISGIDTNSAIKSFTGIDYYNRNFSIDYGQKLITTDYWSQRSYQAIQHGLASLQLQNTSIVEIGNFKFNSTNDPMEGAKSWAMAIGGVPLNDNTSLSMSLSRVPFNPWFSMSGTWGQIRDSAILESSVIHTKGPWSYRGGLMQVTSQYTPGLVTSVKPIYAGWADIEYTVNDNLKVATGVLPYAFAGSVSMTLPTGIDNQGQFAYTNTNSNIKDTVRSYARFDYSGNFENYKNVTYSFTGLVTNQGVPAGRATINYAF